MSRKSHATARAIMKSPRSLTGPRFAASPPRMSFPASKSPRTACSRGMAAEGLEAEAVDGPDREAVHVPGHRPRPAAGDLLAQPRQHLLCGLAGEGEGDGAGGGLRLIQDPPGEPLDQGARLARAR